MEPTPDVSLFLSYATALVTFSAAAVALGLLHCVRRSQRATSILVLGLAMLAISSSLIAIAKQHSTQLLNVLIALGFVATAGYVLIAALSLILMDPRANEAGQHEYQLWVHREGRVARKRLIVSFSLFVGALIVLLVAASPSLFESLFKPSKTYTVYGTCLEGGCGLKQRSGPGAQYHEVDRDDRLLDGTNVLVVCQRSGKPPSGFSNRVWDRLPNGRFVSDAFVRTPNRAGGFSRGIPRCRLSPSGTAG